MIESPGENLPPFRRWIRVPFWQKDAVKALGARWDGSARLWYVPEGLSMRPFQQWTTINWDVPPHELRFIKSPSFSNFWEAPLFGVPEDPGKVDIYNAVTCTFDGTYEFSISAYEAVGVTQCEEGVCPIGQDEDVDDCFEVCKFKTYKWDCFASTTLADGKNLERTISDLRVILEKNHYSFISLRKHLAPSMYWAAMIPWRFVGPGADRADVVVPPPK